MILLREERKKKRRNVPVDSSPFQGRNGELCNRGKLKIEPRGSVYRENREIPSYNLRLYLRFSTSLLLNIYFCVSHIYIYTYILL